MAIKHKNVMLVGNAMLKKETSKHSMPSTKKPDDRTGRTGIHLFFDDALLEGIEDFRFRFRHATRTAAIRELIVKGLDAAKKEGADKRGRKKT